MSELHVALGAASIDREAVKSLIQSNPGILTAVNEEGRTHLHILLSHSNVNDFLEAVQLIIETDPSVMEITDGEGLTPFITACLNKNVTPTLIELLLRLSPDCIQQEDWKAGNALHVICSNGGLSDSDALDITKLLVALNPDLVSATDEYDRIPLHYAASYQSPDCCMLLIGIYPESVYVRNCIGALPIHAACAGGRYETVGYLVDLYPDLLSATDDYDRLPLHHAVGNSLGICKLLVEKSPESVRVPDNEGNLPIHVACSWGRPDAETVEYLVEQYPDSIHQPNQEFFLPVHLAAKVYVRDQVIKCLLIKDPACASVRVAPGNDRRRGWLPLHLACGENGSLGAIKALFDAFPDAINIRTPNGDRPIDLARDNVRWWPQKVSFLQDQHAYADMAQDATIMTTQDVRGRLCLHQALDGSSFRGAATLGAIKLLINGNRDALQAPDDDGALPLHLACKFGTVEVVKYLVSLNDSILNARDLRGNYPLHYASTGANYDVVKYLLDVPVQSISETNADGSLPLHLLCMASHPSDGYLGAERLEAIYSLLRAYPDALLQS